MTTISSLPPVPTRADPLNFSPKADALLTHLEDVFVPEMNAVIGEINTSTSSAASSAIASANSANVSSASANYKGEWSALSGALAIPASVYHSGYLWMLKESIANVTTEVPGVSSKWVNITNFLNGITTAEQARDALDIPANNLIDNSSFAVNQRNKTGTITLSAGAYGHDRWKAGSAGCTYSLITNDTEGHEVVVISAGSLIQIVDGNNLQTGVHTVSNAGTSQIKIGAGSYAASPVSFTASYGSNATIEFGVGTISKPKMEKGSIVTPWVKPNKFTEEEKCRNYCLKLTNHWLGLTQSTGDTYASVQFPAKMRAAPTLESGATYAVNTGNAGAVSLYSANTSSMIVRNSATNWTVGAWVNLTCVLSADL